VGSARGEGDCRVLGHKKREGEGRKGEGEGEEGENGEGRGYEREAEELARIGEVERRDCKDGRGAWTKKGCGVGMVGCSRRVKAKGTCERCEGG